MISFRRYSQRTLPDRELRTLVKTNRYPVGRGQQRYSTEVQQQPLTAASKHDHEHTELAGRMAKRPAAPLVRDEEEAIVPAASDRAVNSRSRRSLTGYQYAYAQTCISLISLRGISERLARTARWTRGTPAALTASSKSPPRLPAGGSNRAEKLNGSSFAGSSNSHSFDQSEPRCLIEIDTSISLLP